MGKANEQRLDQFAIMKTHFNKLAHVLNNSMKNKFIKLFSILLWSHSSPVKFEFLKYFMATHVSILVWGNLMDRGSQQATVHGIAKESNMT